MFRQSPILVTGIPRSGTTMIAKVINACGAYAGDGVNHKRSMFENTHISKDIVKPYMERIGSDPRGQFPLPQIKNITIPLDWRERVETLMELDGYHEEEGGAWMYKDSKMALIWQVWNNAFPNAKWIVVRRRTGDVIQSCLKTGYMTAYDTEKGWLEWIHEYEKRFVQMIEAGVNIKVIWPERILDGNLQQLYEVIDWLGLKWNKEALKYIDPLLWGRQKERRTA